MKCTYKITLDKPYDEWNWYDSSRNPVAYGHAWRDNLRGPDLKFFDKLCEMPNKEAKQAVKQFLANVYAYNEDLLAKNQAKLEREFAERFQLACEWLENTMGKPLVFQKYTIYLTTFPRCPYDEVKGSFAFNVYNQTGLVDTFLHETSHFQFTHYWRNDPKSPVAKLSEDDFHYLKESLSVIIDEDAIPPAQYVDNGYKAHQAFRKVLHQEWQKHHDFDKLVEYGLKRLPEFTTK